MGTSIRIKNLKRLQKYRNKKQRRGRRKQRGGFLNRYDFAYANRVTVNQAMKGLDTLAPKLINQASKEIDKIVEARIRQVINSSGQQIQKIAPQVVRGAIEDVFKTSFRLLGKLWRKIITGTITDKIYHGCATRYANGERKLIDYEKGERCIYAKLYPFWRKPNTSYRMQTRKSTKNRQLIKGPIRYV